MVALVIIGFQRCSHLTIETQTDISPCSVVFPTRHNFEASRHHHCTARLVRNCCLVPRVRRTFQPRPSMKVRLISCAMSPSISKYWVYRIERESSRREKERERENSHEPCMVSSVWTSGVWSLNYSYQRSIYFSLACSGVHPFMNRLTWEMHCWNQRGAQFRNQRHCQPCLSDLPSWQVTWRRSGVRVNLVWCFGDKKAWDDGRYMKVHDRTRLGSPGRWIDGMGWKRRTAAVGGDVPRSSGGCEMFRFAALRYIKWELRHCRSAGSCHCRRWVKLKHMNRQHHSHLAALIIPLAMNSSKATS